MGQDFFDLGIVPADTDYRMLSWRYATFISLIFDGLSGR